MECECDPMRALPARAVQVVLENLSARDLCSFARVCRRWAGVASSPGVQTRWRRLFQSDFPADFAAARAVADPELRWRQAYLAQFQHTRRLAACEKLMHTMPEGADEPDKILRLAVARGYDDVVVGVLYRLARASPVTQRPPSPSETSPDMSQLQQRQADLDSLRRRVATAMVLATQKDDRSIVARVHKLFPKAATFADDAGETALHHARSKEMCSWLLKAGASLGAASRAGLYPIHSAAAHGLVEVVRCMLDPSTINLRALRSGNTPLAEASLCGHLPVVRLLANVGADLKIANNEGMLPIHCAATNDHKDVIEYLLSKGCKPTLVDGHGNSPVDICASRGHLDLVLYLLERVGKIIPLERVLDIKRVPIGSGAFGDVFKADMDGRSVALKQVRFDKLIGAGKTPEWIRQKFVLEVALMNKIGSNPNFVQLLGASLSQDNYWLVLEYMPCGSLFDRVHGISHRSVQLPSVNSIARCIAEGMAYLHAQQPQIIHRDLTSANILLDEAHNPRIADFGISRFKHEIGDQCMTYIGNPRWRAPEVTRGEPYSSAVDVYAFGLILWELVSGKVPFPDLDGHPASFQAAQGKRPEIPGGTPHAWADLIRSKFSSCCQRCLR
eukprot:m51a1_g3877 putative ankyrin repeat-containing protein (616) ;mRNA; f:27799-30238